jgi:hypothetical protein
MPLQRQSDGERLAVAETEIKFLIRGDEELKEKIDDVQKEVGELRDEMRMGFADIKQYLEAQKNQLAGASKLTIIIMKAWPIVATAIGAVFAWESVK